MEWVGFEPTVHAFDNFSLIDRHTYIHTYIQFLALAFVRRSPCLLSKKRWMDRRPNSQGMHKNQRPQSGGCIHGFVCCMIWKWFSIWTSFPSNCQYGHARCASLSIDNGPKESRYNFPMCYWSVVFDLCVRSLILDHLQRYIADKFSM